MKLSYPMTTATHKNYVATQNTVYYGSLLKNLKKL